MKTVRTLLRLALCLLAVLFVMALRSAPHPAVPLQSRSSEAALPFGEKIVVLPSAEPSPSPTPSPTPAPTPTPFPVPPLREYSEEVTAGEVRYVSQLNDVENNGWGKYSWRAGMECTTACISMALSYLGVDASPEAILDYSIKTVLASSYGIESVKPSAQTASFLEKEESFPRFQALIDRYQNGEGNISPVLLYLAGNGHNHALVIIGQEEDEYLAADPTPAGIHRIRIAEDGTISTAEEEYLLRYTASEQAPARISGLAQWEKSE